MAAFTPEDPDDGEAFLKKWTKILGNEECTKKTILVDGEIVGSVLTFVLEGDVEVTYWLGRKYWGRGIATQALACLLREVETRPLFGRTAEDNKGSARVLERNGFVLSGTENSHANARGKEIKELIYRLG